MKRARGGNQDEKGIPKRPKNIVHPTRCRDPSYLELLTKSISARIPSLPEEPRVESKSHSFRKEPSVRLTSQNTLLSDRPSVSRELGRLKDTTEFNRRDIRGDGVIEESEGANLLKRRLPEFTRFV